MLYNVLKYSKSLSEYNLQTEELDIAAAAAALSELMSQVEGMRNDDECKQQYDRACAMICCMYLLYLLLYTTFAGSDVSLSGDGNAPTSQRSRKVPRQLQECVTDQFLTKTPVTHLYDKLHVDFYLPVLDLILTKLCEWFAGKN